MPLKTDEMIQDFRSWLAAKAPLFGCMTGGAISGIYPQPIEGNYAFGLVLGSLIGVLLYLLGICVKWEYDRFKEKYWESDNE